MTSLTEDLQRVATILQTVTDHEVETLTDAVYVNFGFAEAVVVEPYFTPAGKRYVVSVMTWDQTHAVDSETELGVVDMLALPGLVKEFLDEQARHDRELDKLFAMLDTE